MSSNNEFPIVVVNPKTTDLFLIDEEDWHHYRQLADNLIHKKTIDIIDEDIKRRRNNSWI